MFFLLSCGTSLCFGDSRDKLFYDAVRAEASGDLEQAVEIYLLILKDAHSANLHANLGNLYFKLEDYARSILHFRKAIWIDPENRDYLTNLSVALDMNGLKLHNLPTFDSSFSSQFQTSWLIGLSIFFWSGILCIASFFRLPRKGKRRWLIFSGWVVGTALLFMGLNQSQKEALTVNREVIVLNPSSPTSNETSGIPLRVFAGNGSSANTTVQTGTSLLLDLDKDGKPRVHRSQSGEKWYLVRSHSGSNKGWIQRSEFEPILDIKL